MRATAVRTLVVVGALVVCASAAASLGPRKAINPADQARARKVLLALSDLPHGWKAQPSQADNGTTTDSTCVKKGLSDLTETADVSRDFSQATGLPAVESAVGMLKTRTQAVALWQRVPTEKVFACEAANGAGLPKGWHVTFRRLTLPRIGERSIAWQLTLTASALPAPAYEDVVFAGTGRTFSVLALSSLGKPFDPALARRLELRAAARLKRFAA